MMDFWITTSVIIQLIRIGMVKCISVQLAAWYHLILSILKKVHITRLSILQDSRLMVKNIWSIPQDLLISNQFL